MILSAHQPSLIPWLGLLDKIDQCDLFVFFDAVPIESSGFENRQKLLTKDGVQWITVPVNRRRGALIKDVTIVDGSWSRKVIRTIELAYSKAPFFETFWWRYKAIFSMPWTKISDLDWWMLQDLLKVFGIRRPIVKASAYKFVGMKSDLVLDMSKKLGADHYIFGSKGRDYADERAFAEAGITISFQDYKHPSYLQQHDLPFAPNLGCLDLLFNVGPEQGLKIIRSGR